MAKKKRNVKISDLEKEKARQRVLNFKASHPSTFGDALEWQKEQREDRDLPFSILNE